MRWICAVGAGEIVTILVLTVADAICWRCCYSTKCTSAAANVASVEDFGKVIVEVFEKTHYNRECSHEGTLPVYLKSEKEE